MSLGGLNYEELEALVRSWPWWSPDPVLVAAVLALASQRVRDAIAEVRAEEVVRLISVDGPGVYVGR